MYRNTIGVRRECVVQNYGLAGSLKLSKAAQQRIDSFVDDRLQAPYRAFGKERIDSCSPNTVGVVIVCPEHGFRQAKLSSEPIPPMATLAGSRIQLFVEIGCRNMQLIGVDADNRAIFLVHPTNLESILATLNYIVIEFVPIIRQRNLWREAYPLFALPEAHRG